MRSVIHSLVLYNDRFVASGEAVLRPGQVGLFTGWGVFTTLRIYRGIPFAFERHWERLRRDAELLNVAMPADRDGLRERLLELVRRNRCPESKMRLNVMRSQGGLFEGPGSGRATDVVAFTADLTEAPETVALGLNEHGRHAASVEDLLAVAPPVLRHRIVVNFHAEAENVDGNGVVERLLAEDRLREQLGK